MARTVVVKKRTGARWASANPASGIWQKVWGGVGETSDTKRVGFVAQNFFPITGRRACEFEVVA